jgi:ubiquinone/menaquinone biosynthesis C-methylase UbiE
MEKSLERIYGTGDDAPTYLDLQAAVGITKHMGGYKATDQLYRLCHIDQAKEVLDVGCGIGVGPVYMVQEFGCRVVAVDVSKKMLEWAGKRAIREGCSDQIEFHKADVRDLPFENDRFDAVIVESVLAFVEDKRSAIDELIRVLKPGGHIGLNESFWTEPPPKELHWKELGIGPEIILEDQWRQLWEQQPLEDKHVVDFTLDPKQEVRDRIHWIGWRSILPAWGRVIRILISDRSQRDAMKKQLDTPPGAIKIMGYGLFVGRKPDASGGSE